MRRSLNTKRRSRKKRRKTRRKRRRRSIITIVTTVTEVQSSQCRTAPWRRKSPCRSVETLWLAAYVFCMEHRMTTLGLTRAHLTFSPCQITDCSLKTRTSRWWVLMEQLLLLSVCVEICFALFQPYCWPYSLMLLHSVPQSCCCNGLVLFIQPSRFAQI